MKRTAEEHVKRLKKLSLIKEDTTMVPNEPSTSDNDVAMEQEFEKLLGDTLNTVIKELPTLGKKVGDKDGVLELPQETTNENNDVNEAGVGMLVAGSALAAPKVIEMIGKGVKQLGIKADSQMIQRVGKNVAKAGHDLHQKYVNVIKSGLKRLPVSKNRSDEELEMVATGILLATTVALGITSINGLVGAAQAGKMGLAAFEGGLSGVKGVEILAAAKRIIPNILNGILK